MAEKGLREQDICRMGSPEVNESPGDSQTQKKREGVRVQTRSDRVRKFWNVSECVLNRAC